MALSERIGSQVRKALDYAKLQGNIFALQTESVAILEALGVPQAFNLSLKEQSALVDAFSATLAQSKQGGWFKIDTTLAVLRKDTKEIDERYDRVNRLAKAERIYTKRADKKSSALLPSSKFSVEAALGAAQYTYNTTLRGETSRLSSLQTLQKCRRSIRISSQQAQRPFAKAA